MNRNPKRSPRGDDEVEDDQLVAMPFKGPVSITVDRKVFSTYTVRLDDYLEDPADFRGLLNVLDSAGPDDNVIIRLSTGGGSMEIALTIRNALRNSQANTVLVLDSWAASAGTMWFNVVDQVAIQPGSFIMVHGASYGIQGHMAKIKGYVDFSEARLGKLFHEIYEGFMTPEEVDDLLKNNTDVYMEADEIATRIQAMNKHFENKAKAAQAPAKPARKKPNANSQN